MQPGPSNGPVLTDRGFGIVETMAVVVVVSVLIFVVVNHYGRTIDASRKTALKAELTTLRNTVTLYRILNARCPDSLAELVQAEYILPYNDRLFRADYLRAYARDKQQNLLDPFGNPYILNAETCTVSSGTPGFTSY